MWNHIATVKVHYLLKLEEFLYSTKQLEWSNNISDLYLGDARFTILARYPLCSVVSSGKCWKSILNYAMYTLFYILPVSLSLLSNHLMPQKLATALLNYPLYYLDGCFKILFNIIISSTQRSPQWFLLLRLHDWHTVIISSLSYPSSLSFNVTSFI